ncbi:MAG: hypothetical protein COB33_009925 [Thiotrichaceae bacterium]|nr:hypothetical protein [Thiotrichaceae bacterium]MBL1260832.1 hypothetical protein [Thiotrichaceae bacterium]
MARCYSRYTCLLQVTLSLAIDSRYEKGIGKVYYWMVWYPMVSLFRFRRKVRRGLRPIAEDEMLASDFSVTSE